MDLRKSILDEFQYESGLTRSVFESIPDSLLDYQASERVHSIRWNVTHLANIPSWTEIILRQGSFDVAPVGESPRQTAEVQSMQEALEIFDRNVASAAEILADFPLVSLEDPWSLLAGGQPLFTQTRYEVFRRFTVPHVAHHRGHLLAYLKINGVETPALYG